MRRLLAVPATVALLAACSSGAGSGSPTTIAQSSVAAPATDSPTPSATASTSPSPSASPSPAAPAARLAYATPNAVFVVTLDASGRPTAPAQQVSDTLAAGPGGGMSDLQWSRNGRFLIWSQLAPGTEGIAWGVYDTGSGKHVVVTGPSNGAAAATATDSGLLAMTDTRVTSYNGSGAAAPARTVHFQGKVVDLDGANASDEVLGTVAGAEPAGILLTVGDSSSAHLVEVNAAGTAIDLGRLDPQQAPLVNGGAGRDGYLALEQGDHTDGCGVPPASVVLVVTPGSPATPVALPTAPAGAIERAVGVEVSTDHVVGATLVACGNGQGAGYASDFAELHGTRWQVVANDAIDASRGPGGLLAYVHGRIGGEGEKYGPRGDQHLRIATRTGTQATDLGGPVAAVLFAPATAVPTGAASPSASSAPSASPTAR